MTPRKEIFMTGATGYMGSRLAPLLIGRGHTIRALARSQSVANIPDGCTPVIGDPLDYNSFHNQVQPADTWIHLVGVSHPNPLKKDLFRQIDLVSVKAAVKAAVENQIWHFVYVSVAQPAPVMKAYQEVRAECEMLIRDSGLNATFLRPWYVLGPGHLWAYALIPIYKILERIPAASVSAKRLGLIHISGMIAALNHAVEHPPVGIRIIEVPEMKRISDHASQIAPKVSV